MLFDTLLPELGLSLCLSNMKLHSDHTDDLMITPKINSWQTFSILNFYSILDFQVLIHASVSIKLVFHY